MQQNLRDASNRAAQIGQEVINERMDDGSARPPNQVLARGSTEAGQWRPTPPDFRPGVGTQWGFVTPWVLQNIPQNFRMPPPPQLNSQVYQQSYNQVRACV